MMRNAFVYSSDLAGLIAVVLCHRSVFAAVFSQTMLLFYLTSSKPQLIVYIPLQLNHSYSGC